jgi:hypothetical protein
MSYDVHLEDAQGNRLFAEHPHDLTGGTHAVGGTSELWLNITYNYSAHFYRTLGEKGIRSIYGLTGEAAIPLLQEAADQLGDDVDGDYWKPTEGNAKKALLDLIALAKLAPQGIFAGD